MKRAGIGSSDAAKSLSAEVVGAMCGTVSEHWQFAVKVRNRGGARAPSLARRVLVSVGGGHFVVRPGVSFTSSAPGPAARAEGAGSGHGESARVRNLTNFEYEN